MVNRDNVLAMMDAAPGAANAGDYIGWMLGPEHAAGASVSPCPHSSEIRPAESHATNRTPPARVRAREAADLKNPSVDAEVSRAPGGAGSRQATARLPCQGRTGGHRARACSGSRPTITCRHEREARRRAGKRSGRGPAVLYPLPPPPADRPEERVGHARATRQLPT